jgi:hypothetical protein
MDLTSTSDTAQSHSRRIAKDGVVYILGNATLSDGVFVKIIASKDG